MASFATDEPVAVRVESGHSWSTVEADVELGSKSARPGGQGTKKQDNLARNLSNRQVQMIAIGGTIGTGLFLGTGKSLSTGGPGSMILTYALCGFIVYNTMLCLCEMAAYMPIAGSFTTYASRFVDEGFGFALTWNYWLNDAISVASDLVAAQMLLAFWAPDFPGWVISLILLLIIVGSNAVGVRMYGELEYSLAVLKVVTIVLFIIIGILVNLGANSDHRYIGFENWGIEEAPFVGGFGGFASVFVTASFAFGGTESIGVTAGETKNPRRNIPKVIKNVFWRVVLFYLLGTFIIGLNVPYTASGLTDGDTYGSPFTLVFTLAGIHPAAHIMNAVILTSVISAGNHALFAGTRLLYAMGSEGHAPRFFAKLTSQRVPIWAMLATALVGSICFAASYVGDGTLWTWLQALVGVSNQIAWVSIGITSFQFRRAFALQNRNAEDLPFQNPFNRWAPLFVVVANIVLILVQGWHSFVPSESPSGKFDVATFLTYYIEIPFLFLMWLAWKLVKGSYIVPLATMDLDTDRYFDTAEDIEENAKEKKSCWQKFLNVLV
eukprot:Gregarina_sp_Poly_1__2487@NODE_1674_length_3553_cov_1178_510040_g1100_i0_p1_GENE_NODE_1674_length_3553_cov_1178_510040_g1100_i0NODE_1674_length_3553_cov_1178_510040_g1100_i0_p1_ORF_typecomplete_len551_score61_25AA_permease/PF00324_21/2_4e154AA_permease_2/PF13520_6/1_2e58Aa_trans/PF01490_18/8_6e05PrgI/PF12666_7/0_086PrgI/PF12666_7/1_8e04PrgI/PF12666_7/3_5e03PrgI/PF12666_7/1_6e03PrgI/PF12666_7/4_3e03Trp_Tyr_perm/PF03222_13/0_02Trp_Tyr_perm/PF03222_13/8_6e03_NODE_1674_length_3553_cov_1178_510040_g1